MKKTYVTPETEITAVSLEDILTTSSKFEVLGEGDGGYIDGSSIS